MRIQLSNEYDTLFVRIGPTILIGLVLFIASSYFITFKNEPEKWPIGLIFVVPVLVALRFIKKSNKKNYRRLVMEDDFLLIEEFHTKRKIQYSEIYSVSCRRTSLYGIASVLLITGEKLRFSVNRMENELFSVREPAVIKELKKRVDSNQVFQSTRTSPAD